MVDGSLFSGYIVDTQLSIFMTTHIFLLHVSMVDIYMIILMSFVAIVVVHISMINVVCTFVHSYALSLLSPVLS